MLLCIFQMTIWVTFAMHICLCFLLVLPQKMSSVQIASIQEFMWNKRDQCHRLRFQMWGTVFKSLKVKAKGSNHTVNLWVCKCDILRQVRQVLLGKIINFCPYFRLVTKHSVLLTLLRELLPLRYIAPKPAVPWTCTTAVGPNFLLLLSRSKETKVSRDLIAMNIWL